jgi:hypothetical protein
LKEKQKDQQNRERRTDERTSDSAGGWFPLTLFIFVFSIYLSFREAIMLLIVLVMSPSGSLVGVLA